MAVKLRVRIPRRRTASKVLLADSMSLWGGITSTSCTRASGAGVAVGAVYTGVGVDVAGKGWIRVGVAVGVDVAVGDGVSVGVAVWVAVAVAVGVDVGVGVAVSVGVGVLVWVAVDVTVAVAWRVGVGCGRLHAARTRMDRTAIRTRPSARVLRDISAPLAIQKVRMHTRWRGGVGRHSSAIHRLLGDIQVMSI
jgi:hypothetical protein